MVNIFQASHVELEGTVCDLQVRKMRHGCIMQLMEALLVHLLPTRRSLTWLLGDHGVMLGYPPEKRWNASHTPAS